jgi:hypothetical protein
MRSGQIPVALHLYREAAEREQAALRALDKSKLRTLGVTSVSAVALLYKAKEFDRAEHLAFQLLTDTNLPDFATDDLKVLLRTIWSEAIMERAGVKFLRGDVLVSVRGGEVVPGGAPLDLILRKVEEIRGLIYRTAEFLANAPHRKHGLPNQTIQEICRPWLFQAAPGSYQFAVRVQQPAQIPMFPEIGLRVDEVTPKLLQIIRASIEDPEGVLPGIVPNPEYRATFLKMTRNLAPTGKSFTQLEVRAAWPIEEPPITLVPKSRESISNALRGELPRPAEPKGRTRISVQGVLRALHLDQDWLEITVQEQTGERHIHVLGAGDAVDDVIGPMVNHTVVLDASVTRGGRHYLIDLQPAE